MKLYLMPSSLWKVLATPLLGCYIAKTICQLLIIFNIYSVGKTINVVYLMIADSYNLVVENSFGYQTLKLFKTILPKQLVY